MSFFIEMRELEEGRKLDQKHDTRFISDADAWQTILVQYPAVQDVMANFEYCRESCAPKKLTLERFELLLQIPQFVEGLAVAVQPGEVKAKLIEDILLHMRVKDGGVSVKNRRKQLAFWPLDKLRFELLRVQSVTTLKDRPLSELRQIANQGRPSFVAAYPELPDEIEFHGNVVEVTPKFIKRLERGDLKALIRKYGADNVNRRLNGEDQ